MPAPDVSPAALALGRIPTGLYIVSVRHEGHLAGFVASFVMQVGLKPPRVCVAVGKDRAHLELMRAAGRFGLSILDGESEPLMGRFFRKHPPGAGPFDGLEVGTAAGGAPYLAGALAWLECGISGEHDGGDHVVVFAEVQDGAVRRPGDPTIHLRKSGLAY